MATIYSPILGDNFEITVTMPSSSLGASPDTYDILQAGVQQDYTTSPISTFSGRKEIPQLPKVSFTVACLYLEYKPGADEAWTLPGEVDGASGGVLTHDITVDEYTVTGFLRAIQFQSQDFGEGLKGVVVTPVITYAGQRADNCAAYGA